MWKWILYLKVSLRSLRILAVKQYYEWKPGRNGSRWAQWGAGGAEWIKICCAGPHGRIYRLKRASQSALCRYCISRIAYGGPVSHDFHRIRSASYPFSGRHNVFFSILQISGKHSCNNPAVFSGHYQKTGWTGLWCHLQLNLRILRVPFTWCNWWKGGWPVNLE